MEKERKANLELEAQISESARKLQQIAHRNQKEKELLSENLKLKASIEDIAREVDNAPISEDKQDAEAASKRPSSSQNGKAPMDENMVAGLDQIDEENDDNWDDDSKMMKKRLW